MSSSLLKSELNELLTCHICKGFYRDAHTILECMHTFCKSCILMHFHNNNIRGSIQCPQCSVSLGMYGNLNSKMIYDRDVQSIVDKLYPEFIEFEKEEEIQHYKRLKIPLKSAVGKRDRERETESQEQKKRSKLSSGNDDGNAEAEDAKKERVDTEFNVKLNPCEQCDESLRLPMLAKRLCKVSLAVRVLKIKKFVHKRLTDAEQQTVQPEDIELLYNGEVLIDENKLSCLKKEIEAAIASKANIEFVYRRKQT